MVDTHFKKSKQNQFLHLDTKKILCAPLYILLDQDITIWAYKPYWGLNPIQQNQCVKTKKWTKVAWWSGDDRKFKAVPKNIGDLFSMFIPLRWSSKTHVQSRKLYLGISRMESQGSRFYYHPLPCNHWHVSWNVLCPGNVKVFWNFLHMTR